MAKTSPEEQLQEAQAPEITEPSTVTKETPTTAPAPAAKRTKKASGFPYEATVGVSLALVRVTANAGKSSELQKPTGTLKQGTKVTVVAERDGFAQLKNGLWINAAYLTR